MDKPKSQTRLYKIWIQMRRRCDKPGASHYNYYGGRGIRVCDEWHDNFEAFKEWSDKNGYSDNLEIDRIDPDQNYEPSNCRWITHSENAKRSRKPYSHPEAEVRRLHKIWEYCKSTGIDMSNFPEPKYIPGE